VGVAPIAVGVPYWPGVGSFDPLPLLAVAAALLLARAVGLSWTRASVPPIVAVGLLAVPAAHAWGLGPVAATIFGVLVVAASLRRRLRGP
jgi:hypothetical protein